MLCSGRAIDKMREKYPISPTPTPTTYEHVGRKETLLQECYPYTFTASVELLNRAINLENLLSLSL